MTGIAELVATVTYVKRGKNAPKTGTEFTAETSSGNKYHVTCPFFCPIRENDAIYAVCQVGMNGNLVVARPPFVQIPVNRQSIVQFFIIALRGTGIGNIRSNRLYDAILEDAGTEEKVASHLTHLASQFLDMRNSSILQRYSNGDALSLTPDQFKAVLVRWHKSRDMRRLYLFGLNNKEIKSSLLTTEELYKRCLSNPFAIPSISLEKAVDVLARQNKKPNNDDIECGLVLRRVWDSMHQRGWTAVPMRMLQREFPKMMGQIERLATEYDLVVDGDCMYYRRALAIEKETADYLAKMVLEDKVRDDMPMDELVDLEDGTVVSRSSFIATRGDLSDDQIRAIQGALDHRISIITGGAGTGKTTVICEIVKNLNMRGISYVLCSFTGKAVARLREVTGLQTPATMHRLIASVGKGLEDTRFDHLIIDETGMVQLQLLHSFLTKFHDPDRPLSITFIGDVHQLPPIGWGSLFSEIVKSQRIPTYYLTKNFRVYEDDEDGIVLNCQNIINHVPELGPFQWQETVNFQLIEGGVERVYDLINAFYAAGKPATSLTIISPYNMCMDEINKVYQQIYNEGSRSVRDPRGKLWAVNDRVIMTVNSYDLMLFNGQQGLVKDVGETEILVDFGQYGLHTFPLTPEVKAKKLEDPEDDPEVSDESISVKYLDHAFCLTVHRMQGDEADFIVFYIPPGVKVTSFLNNNLIYTALSRARRACWIVSDLGVITSAATQKMAYRCDNLSRRMAHLPVAQTRGPLPLDYDPEWDPWM